MALSLLLLIVLAAADGFRISNLFQQQSDNILAVQWPPNVCRVKNWSGPGCAFDYWTIHGWWPLKATEKDKGDFSMTEIEDLTDNMEQVWPQLSGENNEGFWKYEWDKHGKTAGLAVHDYFEKALGYFNKVLGNCTNPEEISSCLREKGEVKEYQLVKETPGGDKRIEQCTVNECNALTETKGNSDISLRRGGRGRGRRGWRNKHRRRGLGRKNRRKRHRSGRKNRLGRRRSGRKNRLGRRRSGRKNRRGRRRSGRKNRRGRRRSGRKNRRGRRGSHSGSIEHHSGSHSGSIEHHSRSGQNNNQEEYYIVEAWLVLPGNLT
ncbi:uncharacterized protein [Mobula birostris]|uniref:uncharacterized protein isoform X10 n=1 Tax=Mobula birostris TaxID=1983395 RepID=UPI003B281DD1